MKNKIIDYFFTVANCLFFLGIVISSILLIKDARLFIDSLNGYDGKNYSLFAPYIALLVASFLLIVLYLIIKNNYFKLIRMHINKNWIWLHYFSCFLLLISYIFASTMFSCCSLIDPKDLSNWYFYVTISISALLTLIAIGINAYSKIKIKIELAIRRTKGKEETLIDKNTK